MSQMQVGFANMEHKKKEKIMRRIPGTNKQAKNANTSKAPWEQKLREIMKV
jgi:hypothetical protein